MIKKIMAFLLVFSMIALFGLPVYAEPGGEYVLDDQGITVQIPEGWVVFTRTTPQDDPDIDQETFDYDMYISNMIESDIYLTATKSGVGAISLQVSPSEVCYDIGNLTECYVARPQSEREALLKKVGEEMSDSGVAFVGAYYSDEVNKQNNYVYAAYKDITNNEPFLWYATVAGDKRVVISGDFVSEEATKEFYDILANTHFANQPTLEKVQQDTSPRPSSPEPSTNTADEQAKPAFALSQTLLVAIIIAAALLVLVIVIILVRKKRTKP